MEYFIGKDDNGNYFLNAEMKNKKDFMDPPVMNQYEWQEETEEQIINLYGKYGATSKPEKFECVLRHFSSKSDLERKIYFDQWKIYVFQKTTLDPKTCICSQSIHDLRFIQNTINGNILMVGNCCIKKLAKNTKLGAQNADLNNFRDRVIRRCKGCPLDCFALRMRGNYCEDCYWDLEGKKREKIDKGKRCCAHCFEKKRISLYTDRCGDCLNEGKEAIKFIFLGDAYEKVKENKIVPIKISDSKKSTSEAEDSEDLIPVRKSKIMVLDDSSNDSAPTKMSQQTTILNDCIEDIMIVKNHSNKVVSESSPQINQYPKITIANDSSEKDAPTKTSSSKKSKSTNIINKKGSNSISDSTSDKEQPKYTPSSSGSG